MGSFDYSMHSFTNLFFEDPSSHGHGRSAAHFLLEPNLAHGLSGLAHLVLLLVICLLWVCLKLKAGSGECQRQTRCLYYKGTFICCLLISVFNLVFFSLDCFYWYRNGWSEENLVSLLDFALKTLAWGIVSSYFHCQVRKSGKLKFSIHLRVWWVSYLAVSCYCLVVDSVLYRQTHSLPVRFLVSDVMSVVSGLLTIYFGFFGKSVSENNTLEEHLLNGETRSTALSNGSLEPKKCRGDETVTPYDTAGIFSILSFSWIGPLIATGNKMALDLEDIPQLASRDAVSGTFQVLRNKLESECGTINRVTTLSLVKGWEMKFLSKISELRNIEAGWLKKFLYTMSVTTFVFWGAPTFVSVVSFGTCILVGIPLESGKVLSALATFRILQETINNLPDTISMVVQTKVSLDRIVSFLRLDDLQSDIIERLPTGSSPTAVEIVNGNFSWDSSSSNPTLRDINIKVEHGMRVAVCGTVGSGKSSLLSCILGEVPKISGNLRVCGAKAYVAQSPWIQSGKIEENILFSKEMDRERYKKVLEACCLEKDLEVLAFGDQTVIGERGINLSGGQKQRIQIARALYQDADIYLFDDPFSAVDAHTGSHLFKECLLGLLSSKTVIYVTHQVEFLPAADIILVMKDGRIAQAGKYNEILSSGTDFMALVGAHEEALSAIISVQGDASEKSASKEDGSMPSTNGIANEEDKTDIQDGKVVDANKWKVSENGENWSMGQRQLVCLGRVLLKKSKVLVLDEATASVDTATDNLIQQTLREHFSNCTVITIAHRITSVLGSDMVLLLSHGLIEEYDTPTRLLEDKSSSFSQLVAEYTQRSSSR
ncbi:ABC transporter C family member 3-like [Momordica charantia]|uniref:ABC-type xenobiotic transporter n=1 Tax=Momordica charantia TaxID=3673 RepID=A0A6J1CEM8_MOMCH|nr:ABC transporter C family member 3-like [Momordica charantia]